MDVIDLREETELAWLALANCADLQPEDFFVSQGSRVTNQVLATCAACPVRTDCLSWALTEGLEWGVFGGLTRRERRECGSVDEAVARSDAKLLPLLVAA